VTDCRGTLSWKFLYTHERADGTHRMHTHTTSCTKPALVNHKVSFMGDPNLTLI